MMNQSKGNKTFRRGILQFANCPAMRIALWYALFGSTWILFSDRLMNVMISDRGMVERLSIAKGLFYVIATTVLIYYLIARHLSEIGKRQARLNYLAYTDELTGLPNKAMLKKTVTELIESNNPFIIAYIDIDNFKTVNDRFGHAVGDCFINCVGNRLKEMAKQGDFLAWMGSDEFVLLRKRNKDTCDTKECMEKILEGISLPFQLEGKEIIASASIGVAIYPQDGLYYDKLIAHANLAMFAAKAAGKSCCKLYTPAYSTDLQHKSEIEADIRKGLQNGEFELFYQPIIQLNTGKLHSLEALVRWCHPEKGWIPPGEFIPIAEDTGLILKLGEFIMRQGMLKAAELAKNNLSEVIVSINISTVQLQDPHFSDMVARMLSETGADGRYLIFEITESFVIKDIRQKVLVLNNIKKHNIKIALDDFGTGYSSLTYLSQLPVDIVKIDRSFVSKLSCKRTSQITNAIITVSHQLNLEVVGEGVETEEQRMVLEQSGCDYIQGYLISHPVKDKELLLI